MIKGWAWPWSCASQRANTVGAGDIPVRVLKQIPGNGLNRRFLQGQGLAAQAGGVFVDPRFDHVGVAAQQQNAQAQVRQGAGGDGAEQLFQRFGVKLGFVEDQKRAGFGVRELQRAAGVELAGLPTFILELFREFKREPAFAGAALAVDHADTAARGIDGPVVQAVQFGVPAVELARDAAAPGECAFDIAGDGVAFPRNLQRRRRGCFNTDDGDVLIAGMHGAVVIALYDNGAAAGPRAAEQAHAGTFDCRRAQPAKPEAIGRGCTSAKIVGMVHPWQLRDGAIMPSTARAAVGNRCFRCADG
jgi:hypothetical protein